MRNVDRRQWLKTIGLSSGFALFGGLDALALDYPERQIIANSPVKLSSNENPYGPSKRVRSVMTSTFDKACRYPFGALRGLVDMIAEKEGVTKDHVVVTGGSTEGLKATGLVYGLGGGEIIAADPTFQAMLRYAETFDAYVHRVPLDEQMGHDLEAMGNRVNNKTQLIFICNPNNPTGTLLDPGKLKDFCTSYDKQALIFSDEAYYDFITEPDYPSMVELVKQGRNLIVSKTFSKVYGLAGLRIGYLIARPDIADRLKAAVMANTNMLAIEAAKEALRDDDFYKYSLLKNKEAKDLIYKTLDQLGLPYIKSHTNFVFFKSGRQIQSLITDMQKEGVLIGRPFPPLYDWARISTGTMEEVTVFCEALKRVMA
ncbi:MAG: histidinol-phosphate aminotransferase family protein [Flavobacteriaceae bacterium]|nr:histidinol-phosphate aminotransferase family protein [Eudoraea sp.]NNJ38215.1 histidinol-phosphate aminotransferase family protein [Flavobacteriaceae bacterium]